MSVFKRANWHSGLTYRQTCEECKTIIEYTDYNLDYRPWFADGFVYCPKCKTPLRHNEGYAINAPQTTQPQNAHTQAEAKFCTQCGYKFNENDRFCAQCGKKRQ